MKKFTIAGTGSRELVQDEEKFGQVLLYLIDLLGKAQVKHGKSLQVISGMAEGFDEALARAALVTGVDLVAAVPSRGYSKYYWKDHSLTDTNRFADFQKLAQYANSTGGVVYTCGCVKSQPAKCGHWDGKIYNFTRNEWMVDRADILWVYNPATKGTGQAYSYAKSKGIRTYLIPVVS